MTTVAKLEKVSPLTSGAVRGVIVAVIAWLVSIPQVLVFLATLLGIEADPETVAASAGGVIFNLLEVGGMLYAGYMRMFRATPPLTDTAVAERKKFIKIQEAEK